MQQRTSRRSSPSGDQAGEDRRQLARQRTSRRSSPSGDQNGEEQGPPLPHPCKPLQAGAVLAAQADPISATMAAGARTGGRQAVAVFRLAVPVLRVAAAAQIQVDPVEGGRPTMETGTAVTRVPVGPEVPAAGGREVPAAEEAILAAREEDAPGSLAPQMTAMTETAGATAPDRIWRRYSTGL